MKTTIAMFLIMLPSAAFADKYHYGLSDYPTPQDADNPDAPRIVVFPPSDELPHGWTIKITPGPRHVDEYSNPTGTSAYDQRMQYFQHPPQIRTRQYSQPNTQRKQQTQPHYHKPYVPYQYNPTQKLPSQKALTPAIREKIA